MKTDISPFIITDKCCHYHYSFYKYNPRVSALNVTEFSLIDTGVREQIGLELPLPSQG